MMAVQSWMQLKKTKTKKKKQQEGFICSKAFAGFQVALRFLKYPNFFRPP